MKRRDFMVALAVCAGVATPAVRELIADVDVETPVLALEQDPRSSPGDQPQRSDPPQPDGPEPTPDPTPDPYDPPKEPEPAPDGCPACGMARVQPRGKKFLSSYVN